jgi:hypothetical protein
MRADSYVCSGQHAGDRSSKRVPGCRRSTPFQKLVLGRASDLPPIPFLREGQRVAPSPAGRFASLEGDPGGEGNPLEVVLVVVSVELLQRSVAVQAQTVQPSLEAA